MYLGIDLGTSNSAIAGNDEAGLRLYKTAEGTDVLPSAILIDRRGSMMVGKRAYEQAAYSPENVAQGFKRLMGTSSSIKFAASGHEMKPEAASAEILKALVAQARMAAGDFVVRGAVVTVPAAFNQMQSEATMRAAKEAGLEKVALLQEPIAAAMASVVNSKKKDGHFLVYDLGGGTFDAAIVQSIAGTVAVVAHAGINMLGGRDFDRSIVNSVVRPWLFQNFDLEDDFQSDSKYLRLLRVAQYKAELAKIALSTQMADRIFADEIQVGSRDRKGTEIYLDIEIRRANLEGLIGEEIGRTTDLCLALLAENGYRPPDIDKIVMIGGPSRMPVVRDRVKSGLGIPIDLSTDPMTAVAIGAAIYAEGRDWTGATTVTKKSRGRFVAPGPLRVRYDYPARTPGSRIHIKAHVDDESSVNGSRIQVETQDGWSSGQLALTSKTEFRDVPLGRRGENRIRITVFDATGLPRSDASTELTVTRIEAAADGMPLMHNIAIKVVGGAVGAEKNVLKTIVRKGTPIPKSGAEQFRAARDFKAGDGTTLDVEVYEQVDEQIDEPELNLPIGFFQLDSKELSLGEVIRRGEIIFIQWEIDANGLLDCEVEFQSIGRKYNTGKMYVPVAGHKNFDGEDGSILAGASLQAARADIDQLERALGARVANYVVDLRNRLNRQFEALRLATEADTKRSISEEARSIRQDVARLRRRPEFNKSVVRAEIDDFMENYSVQIAQNIDAKVNVQVNRLAGLARDALRKDAPHAASDAKRSLDELKAIVFADLAKKPGFWVALFEDSSDRRYQAIDKSRHDELVARGLAAISKEDIDVLREIVSRMHGNMVRDAKSAQQSILAGLMM